MFEMTEVGKDAEALIGDCCAKKAWKNWPWVRMINAEPNFAHQDGSVMRVQKAVRHLRSYPVLLESYGKQYFARRFVYWLPAPGDPIEFSPKGCRPRWKNSIINNCNATSLDNQMWALMLTGQVYCAKLFRIVTDFGPLLGISPDLPCGGVKPVYKDIKDPGLSSLFENTKSVSKPDAATRRGRPGEEAHVAVRTPLQIRDEILTLERKIQDKRQELKRVMGVV